MVSASTGAMNSVLSKLATLLEEECNPQTRNSIISLKSALTSMKSFVESRMASTEDVDPLVEGWINQVRDMTYDLEDCIDDFMRPAVPGDTSRVAQLLKMVKWRRQYASLLQDLKERVCTASERRWRYLRVDIDCKDAEAREVEAAEDAIRGAVSSHPAHPILELRRLGGADVVMDDVDITVDGEGAEGHNDVESGEMVEEELISPAESQQPQPQQQQTLPQLQQQLLDLIRGVDVFCVVEDAASAQLSRVINLVSRRFKGGVSAHPPAEVGDTLEALKDLVQSASDAEQDLLADASRIADRCGKTCKGKAECLLAVADGLRALGYDATVCKSRWYKTKSYPAGEHEYIDMVVGGNLRLLVDVDFRSALQMATTKAYRETLPPLFVGTQERLEQIVAIVTEAAQQSFKKEGLHVPPWRKLEYMRAKWLSPHVRESSTKKESSDIEEMQVSRT
ncbi:hypothetical protein ACQ4PT_013053 [Festuca glaucescens]